MCVHTHEMKRNDTLLIWWEFCTVINFHCEQIQITIRDEHFVTLETELAYCRLL
jgi:hypothetical protein